MKKKHAIFISISLIMLIFMVLFSIMQFKHAKAVGESGVQINLNKIRFLPHETLQIEIFGDFRRPITKNDIYVKKNDLIMPVNFYVEKINRNYYFAYAQLNLVPNDYTLEIKVNGDSGVETYSRNIKITQTNNQYYLSLFNTVRDRWQLLNNRDLIYSLQAIRGIDQNQEELAFNEFMQRQHSFNNIEKALSLIVTKNNRSEWLITKSQLLNYFLTLQDNALGEYKINIKTPIKLNCTIKSLNFGSIIGEKNISVTIDRNSTLNFSFYCFKVQDNIVTNITQQDLGAINVTLIKKYFANQKIYQFNKRIEIRNNIKSAFFWIEKELGSINGDSILTSLILISFYQNNISQYQLAYSWLKKQQNLGVIENIALAMLNDSNAINNLLDLQNYDGSFNPQTGFSKAELTCLAYRTNLLTKTLVYEWIKNNINNLNIRDIAACLVFALKKQDIVSILPGIIKTQTGGTFDLYLKNYGLKEINVSLKNLAIDLNYTTSIKVGQLKRLTITVPNISYSGNSLQDKIGIHYASNFYLIPIIIFIEETNVTQSGINESETNEIIINQTEGEANIIQPLLNIFSVTPESINTIVSNITKVNLTLRNIANYPINNIIISQSASLFGIIKDIQPSIINKLMPNEEKNLEILFDVREQQFNSFTGTITIEGIINGTNREMQIPVNVVVNRSRRPIGLRPCNELNGSICNIDEKCDGNIVASIEGACCLGRCITKKKSSNVLGIIFIVIALIFIIIAVFFVLKKPKSKEKGIEEAIKRIQEKQKLKSTGSNNFKPRI